MKTLKSSLKKVVAVASQRYGADTDSGAPRARVGGAQ